MTTTPSQKIQAGLGALMAAVGAVGTVAPGRVNPSAAAGPSCDASRHQTQLWTLRESALGLLVLGTLNSSHRRRVLAVVVGLATAEAIVNVRSPALSGHARLSGAAVPAVLGMAAAGAVLLERAPGARTR
jgi:hypothetical protein